MTARLWSLHGDEQRSIQTFQSSRKAGYRTIDYHWQKTQFAVAGSGGIVEVWDCNRVAEPSQVGKREVAG